MKHKIWQTVKVAVIALLAACLCYEMIHTVDFYMNGVLLNWFTWNFTITHIDSDGTFYYLPHWDRIKMLAAVLLVAAVEICVLVTYLVSRFYGRRMLRASITETSRMIHSYMQQETGGSQIFPQEYAEISAEMAEIKSAMQRHEQALREEVRRKNDLIVYLAHDLKTPLTSVIGYLSLLKEAPDMPQEQKAHYVDITFDKALRLEKLINEFFEITRYNLQEIILEKEHINLSYMLIQMTDEFYPLLHAHGNTTKLQVQDDLALYGDPDKLARVFNNILKNAVAYSYPDTPITITAGVSADNINIIFENQGRTIPPQKLERIFEKFFRLDNARATNTGGAGLGLAIAREIVELHGGTITASSKDERTSFLVTLPVM